MRWPWMEDLWCGNGQIGNCFASALASMPPFVVATHDRLMVTLGPIEAGPENGGIARHIAEELAIALMRAGVSVVSLPGTAPYYER